MCAVRPHTERSTSKRSFPFIGEAAGRFSTGCRFKWSDLSRAIVHRRARPIQPRKRVEFSIGSAAQSPAISAGFDSATGYGFPCTTSFSSVPMGSMVMRIRSPAAKVKESGGTMPVPVSRKAPKGKLLSRNRYSARVDGARFSSASVVAPENSVRPWRTISRRMGVEVGSVSRLMRTQGPNPQLPS